MIKKLSSENRILKKSQHTDNSKLKLLVGSGVATLIAITPYLFYLYESVPEDKIWSTFLFTYESFGWENAHIAWWVYMGKLMPLFLLFIWFFTCRHWWYHTLLVPISMYIFQLIMAINDDVPFMDDFQLIYLVPVMIVVIPSIYIIRAKFFIEINLVEQSHQELEDELKFKPKNVWGKISNYF